MAGVPALAPIRLAPAAADDQMLVAPLAARADSVVSGDAHLLDLKGSPGIAIAAAAAAVEPITAGA
jgi:predicted nucleic acid-binding protein